MSHPTRIAIIGAGPAGATTAFLLARRGADVTLYDDGQRPDLTVGESLVPQLTAIFQRLGLEEKVRGLGVVKPGVTFAFDEGEEFKLSFRALQNVLPNYAYNVPRAPFDAMLLQTAREAGVNIVKQRAVLEAEGDRVHEPGSADVVVDASGRRRLFSKLLGLESVAGPRRDVSHFAHYEGCDWPEPRGQVEIRRLAYGWSWCIPLPGERLSIGVVMNKDRLRALGATSEEQLEAAIGQEPGLQRLAAGRRRVSLIATFANYQLRTTRGAGANWVLVGDAFGFVDPMLSPGLCLAMSSAEKLAAALPATGGITAETARALGAYTRWFDHTLTAWQEFIEYFYDGRIFAIQRSGTAFSREYPGAISASLERHASKHLSGMASGALTAKPYSRGLLRFMEKYLMNGIDPRQFAIR